MMYLAAVFDRVTSVNENASAFSKRGCPIHCAVSTSLQVNPCSVRVYLRPNSPMNDFGSNFACASVNVSKMCIIKLQNVSGFNVFLVVMHHLRLLAGIWRQTGRQIGSSIQDQMLRLPGFLHWLNWQKPKHATYRTQMSDEEW